MKKYTVFFAADVGYISHLNVAIKSLLENNKDVGFELNVISEDFSSEKWLALSEMISFYPDVDIFYHEINASSLSGLKTNCHFKISNYFRLFISELSKDDKVLYLDCDLIVAGSIKEVFDENVEDFFIAAVENPGFSSHKELKMKSSSKYFNSGVMLINVNKWRESNLFERVVEFVDKNSNVVSFVDQCGLNAVIDGNWKELKPKFNQQSVFFEVDSQIEVNCFNLNDFNEALNNPSIIHYTGTSKPWHLNNKHKFKKLYWYYRNKTSYKSFFSDDFSIKNLLIFCMPRILKKFVNKVRK